MGTFATTITLVGVDASAVEPLLVERGRSAYVGTWGGDTVVFEAAGEVQDGSHATLALDLSAVLGCVALATLNHDDDVLYVQVFESGAARGELNTAPDFFADAFGDGAELDLELGPDGEPARWAQGLDPAALVALVGRGDVDRVAAVAGGDAVFASDVHAALVAELGLPAAAVGLGYRYLAQGERPADAEAGGLRHVGEPVDLGF